MSLILKEALPLPRVCIRTNITFSQARILFERGGVQGIIQFVSPGEGEAIFATLTECCWKSWISETGNHPPPPPPGSSSRSTLGSLTSIHCEHKWLEV